jgi:hypothetical protein
MIENEDFKTLRRHTRQEAAGILNVYERWLKEWVSDNLVPHQRKREVRGRTETSASTGPGAADSEDETAPAAGGPGLSGSPSAEHVARFRNLRLA